MATAETHQSSSTLNYEWRSENGEMINNGKLHVHMALTLFAGFFASRSRDSVLLQEKDGYAVQAAKRQNNLIFTSASDAT